MIITILPSAVSLDVGHTVVKTVRNNALGEGCPRDSTLRVSMSLGGVIELDPRCIIGRLLL